MLVEPLSYSRFLSLQTGAAGVVTDSGGIQEETTALGIPCFTLRDNTERPVTVTHGTNVVLGLDPQRLAEVPLRLHHSRPTAIPPLWDGRAGRRSAIAIDTLVRGGQLAIPEIPAPTTRTSTCSIWLTSRTVPIIRSGSGRQLT